MSDIFHDIAGNPRPKNMRSGYITARDGTKLRYASFSATGRPLKGSVLILPGRNEAIEKYFETIRDLSERGLGVAIMDWRGQGGSQRLLKNAMRGYVRSFDDYVEDLDLFFEEVVLPDTRGPYYVLGHSTGSLIGLLAAPRLVNRVRRMVLVAPFLAPVNVPLGLRGLRRLSGFMRGIGLGRLYAYGGPRPREGEPFVTNKLTSDLDRYTRNVQLYDSHPELALGGPTFSWVRAAIGAIDRVTDERYMDALNLPILFVAAGADQVVSTRAVETYARRLKCGSLLTIDGARHEILQEADLYREQLFAAFDAFVPGTEVAVA